MVHSVFVPVFSQHSIHKLRRYWFLLDMCFVCFHISRRHKWKSLLCLGKRKLHRIWVQVLANRMCAFSACMLVFKECKGIGALEQVISPWACFPHLEIRSLNKFLWHKFHDSLWEISLFLSVWKLLYMSPLSTNEKSALEITKYSCHRKCRLQLMVSFSDKIVSSQGNSHEFWPLSGGTE